MHLSSLVPTSIRYFFHSSLANEEGLMGMAYLPVVILLLLSSFCKSDDQLTHGKPLSPGEVLISKGGVFALGFFSRTNSNKSLYVGIWYHNIPERTVVWVANRDNPITTSTSATLAISNNSDIELSDSEGRTLWTTKNNITAEGTGATAVLLNTGNLVLRLPSGTDIWQSFDHPTNTILPGMRFLLSYKSRVVERLVAWRGPDDPSTGDLSFSLDPSSELQSLIWNGTNPYCRGAVWTGVSVTGLIYPSNTSSFMYVTAINTGDEFYTMYKTPDGSPCTRMILDYTGVFSFLSWNSNTSSWTAISKQPTAACELYAYCGPFGYCDLTRAVPTCQCLDGFEPDILNFSRGCRRKEALKCDKENRFVTLPGMKIPDKFLRVSNRSFDQCAAECSRNCSCTAYAYANLSNGGVMTDQSRCLVWTGGLVDMWKLGDYGGENLYLRLADSPVQEKSNLVKILLPITSCLVLLTCITLVWIQKYRGKQQKKEIQKRLMLGNLSDSTELGGENGTLEGGREVAIKRLIKGSGQGIEEFKNEVVLMAKLQHRNLVRLLGCCTHEDEKLLIYEYLPNRSLDAFLFDATRISVLDWPTRFKIINGVARGLLYLHQDSRLRIIHRDLKASNILLDTEMSPKISDFGTARIFGGNQQQANTTRVVGTYGYMSPEYAMGGAFSVKSDTYSFGVLLLEIVSGLKINSPQLIMSFSSLTAYAWTLWKDGNAWKLVDSTVVQRCPLQEVLRCIHVGLLCVQDHPNARPLMSSIVFMLENESALIPAPKEPAYFALRDCETEETRENMASSVNTMSTTTLEGR